MSKIAFLAICLVLMVCMLTGCRGNTSAETSAPSESGTQSTSSNTSTPTTRPTEASIIPTMDLVPDGSEGGNATDGDGIIDDGMNGNRNRGGMRRMPSMD